MSFFQEDHDREIKKELKRMRRTLIFGLAGCAVLSGGI